ncbi:hypothetical protein L3X38_038491 [Prunus dulcis]|uniref:Uncharacterized protein n=1 Tax=Prunus dulcis TaxID=3755 RepID=A0AAD4V5P9_PRUDU|nr:hypothetical protein L3X38_038491 [Prunus dulcis]
MSSFTIDSSQKETSSIQATIVLQLRACFARKCATWLTLLGLKEIITSSKCCRLLLISSIRCSSDAQDSSSSYFTSFTTPCESDSIKMEEKPASRANFISKRNAMISACLDEVALARGRAIAAITSPLSFLTIAPISPTPVSGIKAAKKYNLNYLVEVEGPKP